MCLRKRWDFPVSCLLHPSRTEKLSVYYFFSLLVKLIPGFAVSSYWQNFVTDIIIFLGLLMTIVTAKGQREALKQGIVRQFKREPYEAEAKEENGGEDK